MKVGRNGFQKTPIKHKPRFMMHHTMKVLIFFNFGEMQNETARFQPDSSTYAWQSAANTQLSNVKLEKKSEKKADEPFEMKLDNEVVPQSDMHTGKRYGFNRFPKISCYSLQI